MVFIGHAHVDQSVNRKPVPGQAIVYCLWLCLVGVVGGYRDCRLCGQRNTGRLCGQRFEPALPPLDICYSLCQRLILRPKLPGFLLKVRKFIGMRNRRDVESRRCKQYRLFHERPQN